MLDTSLFYPQPSQFYLPFAFLVVEANRGFLTLPRHDMQPAFPAKLVPFFLYILRPYRLWVGLMVLSGLIWGVQNSLTPYFFKIIIDHLSAFEGDKAQIWEIVLLPALAYLGVWGSMTLNFRFTDWVHLKLFPYVRRDIIELMFSYLGNHAYSYLQNNFAGSIANKITELAGATVSIFLRTDEMICNICFFCISLLFIGFVSPFFSGILFLWGISFITITLLFARKTKRLSKEFSASKTELSGHIVDTITNLTNVRLFARRTHENTRLATLVGGTVEKDRAVQLYILYMRIWWDVTFLLLAGSTLFFLLHFYSQGFITVGDFAYVLSMAINVFMHVWHSVNQFVQFAEEMGRCAQALTLMNVPHEVVDVPDAIPLQVTRGEIIFENVDFHYHHQTPLFHNKNLIIHPGEKVGLVGFSGSGKTTCVNLILRFFDIHRGRILIDGQEIARVTQDSLREQIAMIPQDTFLFHRTLMENIRYGRLDASDTDVYEAAQKAHCHEFIDHLPEKYETLVGERGIKLSGGQRQRIAIARAILKNAPILILDEATSALDTVTEKHIQAGLDMLMEDRTTIVIAHRLSTLARMDRILVFEKGRIVEEGPHVTLLGKAGYYAKMWHMQAGGFLPETEEQEVS